MAVVRKKDFRSDIDERRSTSDIQKRLLDEALLQKGDVKNTTLSRLHSMRTEVIYYEQVISNRQGNLANTSSANRFDANLQRFKKITNFVVLTDELDGNVDKDVFTDITYEGTAKILPNTIIPNINDYFLMKVYSTYHAFRIVEVNPFLVEKDSGYEIRFSIFRQDVIPETFEFNNNVLENYTFDYNHIGTDFRTILRTDEYEFIQDSRDLMYELMEVYRGAFYHKTLNTVMCEVTRTPLVANDAVNDILLKNEYTKMIGGVLLEGRSFYDINLVAFINKFDIFSPSNKVHIITEHIKPTKSSYRGSIFSVMEHMDLGRLKNKKLQVIYSNTNLYNDTNRLYGRFLLEHVHDCDQCQLVVDLFPVGFFDKIENFIGTIQMIGSKVYSSANDIFIDMLGAFLSDNDINNKRAIIIRLMSKLKDTYIDYLYDDEYVNSSEVFYTYPLIVYLLKYMTREISHREYK